jgi:type VI secretion system secreted protein Hcp
MAMVPLEIFLKLDGIDGESSVNGHEKETIVLSYEQGIDHPAAPPMGGGMAAGRSNFSGVRLRKFVDVGSIPLLLACATGSHIKNAKFTFRNAGSGFEFYKITLDDVAIVAIVQRAGTGDQYPLSFTALNSGADSSGMLDQVTLAYTKIRWEYVPQKADGSPGTPIKGGWDVQLGKKL